MTSPYARAGVFLVFACTAALLLISTAALLLISTKVTDAILASLVRMKFLAATDGLHSDVARAYPNSDASVRKTQPIPKILHHVYLDGLDRLKRAEIKEGAKPGQRFPGYNGTWRHSCHFVHNHWQYMFWNNSQAENLIRTAYPWFLATFQSYNNYVQKGDFYLPQCNSNTSPDRKLATVVIIQTNSCNLNPGWKFHSTQVMHYDLS